jgi:hypothetical protein
MNKRQYPRCEVWVQLIKNNKRAPLGLVYQLQQSSWPFGNRNGIGVGDNESIYIGRSLK